MHCASCEVLIERKLRKVPGVKHVKASLHKGQALVTCKSAVSDTDLEAAIASAGYSLKNSQKPSSRTRRATEIGAALLIVFGAFLLLQYFDIGKTFGVTDHMSLGFIFVLGLVASVSSCLAVTGGLLLSVTAAHSEQAKGLSRKAKLRPLILFNIGRIAGYTLLGGLVGVLGSTIALTTTMTGALTILASIVMVLLGLQLLGVPFLQRFQPRMPKWLAHKLYDSSSRAGAASAFGFGASTFFLPCGFTYALQLYVLSQGSFMVGALTMLAFSIGTAPALFSVGALTTTKEGTARRVIITAAAFAVIALGVLNVSNGVALTGLGTTSPLSAATPTTLSNSFDETSEVQVVRMRVVGYEYEPSQFTVVQGVPVEWVIDASQAAGCARVITAPSIGVTEFLSSNRETTIRFTPSETGSIPFSCTMAMTTPGARFDVIANPSGTVVRPSGIPAEPIIDYTQCDPSKAMCVPAQELSMEVTREKGFAPNVFTVTKGVPVELTIDAKVVPGGCMSTLVIPGLDVGHQITAGKSIVRFTATKPGTYPITCSMGSQWGTLTVL